MIRTSLNFNPSPKASQMNLFHRRGASSLDKIAQKSRYEQLVPSRTNTNFRKKSSLGQNLLEHSFQNYKQIKNKQIHSIIDNYFEEQLSTKIPQMRIKKRYSNHLEEKKTSLMRQKPQILWSTRKTAQKQAQMQDEMLSKSINLQPHTDLLLRSTQMPPIPSTEIPLSTTFKFHPSNPHLPSIQQQEKQNDPQQEEELLRSSLNYTQTSFLARSTSMLSEINPEGNNNEQIVPIYENQLFRISVAQLNKKPIYRIKEFSKGGMEIMKREQRASKYGLPSVWKESQHYPYGYTSNMSLPIREQLFRLAPDENVEGHFKVKPKQYYQHLLANHCQQLIMNLKNLCNDLKKVQGKIINNKLNLSNIFMVKGRWALGEWGFSCFRQSNYIQQNTFESRLTPVLRGKIRWFVPPQYLAPEVLSNMFQNEKIDLWGSQSSPDIWSLGVMLFEIMTMIPISMPSKCTVIDQKLLPSRAGLIDCSLDPKKIVLKQRTIQKAIQRCLTTQVSQAHSNHNLNNLIVRMVEFDALRRITLDEILQQLK